MQLIVNESQNGNATRWSRLPWPFPRAGAGDARPNVSLTQAHLLLSPSPKHLHRRNGHGLVRNHHICLDLQASRTFQSQYVLALRGTGSRRRAANNNGILGRTGPMRRLRAKGSSRETRLSGASVRFWIRTASRRHPTHWRMASRTRREGMLRREGRGKEIVVHRCVYGLRVRPSWRMRPGTEVGTSDSRRGVL